MLRSLLQPKGKGCIWITIRLLRVLRATPLLACGSGDPPEHTRQGGRFLRLCRSPKPATQRLLASLSCCWQWDLLHVLISVCIHIRRHTCMQRACVSLYVCIYIYIYIYIYIFIYLSLSLSVYVCVFYLFKFITQGHMWPPVVLHLHTKGCNRSKTRDHVLGGRGSIYQALLPKLKPP